MQFNTAVGLLLCSAGLFLVPAAAARTVAWTGGMAALIGGTTLAEYAIGADLHVDQLLFKSWLVLGSGSPGRMGVNTAICMVFTSVALILMAVPAKRRRYSLAIALAGSGVSIVSMVAVVGYSMNLESGYRWGARTQMAENTTLAFLMIGVGLITCAVFDAGNGRPLHCPYTPGIAGVASLVFTLLLWQALAVEQNGNLERGAQAATAQVAFEVRAQLANLDGALQRISRRWPAKRVSVTDPSLPGSWQFDASEYIADFPGLEALQWRNETTGEARVTPGTFPSAPSRPGFTMTGPHPEFSAGSRTIAFVGYQSWLGAVLHKEVATGYSIAVGVDGQNIFRRGDRPENRVTQSTVTAAVDVAGAKWTVRVWPGPSVLASSASQLTSLVLMGGLFMSFLLALTARLVLIASERADAIEKANRHLQREIAERSRAETRLQEARSAAEVATRAKSEFLSNMSHEIRSPMNAILGMADLLWESELSAEQREYVGAFRRAGTNLLSLINDILDLAKIEAGKIELYPVDFELSDVVAAVDVLRGRAEAKGVKFLVHILPDVPRSLNGDAGRLRQVLINLLGNAIKFTSTGEVGLIVAPEKSGDALRNQGERTLRFNVTDTGPGIPAKRLAQIFESFTQADNSTSHQFGGTGLGLTISRNLVELMGGRLEVSSEVGKGSVFTFALRFAAATNPQPRAAVTALPSAMAVDRPLGSVPEKAKRRILLVEDSKDNQLLVLAYLKHSPYFVEIAPDGQAAIDQYTRGAFDLVLMDVQLPFIDGYTATRKIREWEVEQSARHVPILALTANAMTDESRRSREAGCDALLTKPIAKATLLKAIAEHLQARLAIRVVAPEGLEELVPGYLKNLHADLQSLGAALEKHDYGSIQVTGHQMKGAGAGYGFAAITDIGRGLESAAKAATAAEIQVQIGVLADYLNRVEIVSRDQQAVTIP